LLRGLYSSATSMLALMNKQEVIANNLANANTNGFKRDYISIRSFPEVLIAASTQGVGSSSLSQPIGRLSFGVGIGETGFVDTLGVLKETGEALDLALAGEGYFAVQTPAGEMYTRNGNFSKDAFGRLVDQDGNFVLGENGIIKINGSKILIDTSGKVFVDDTYKDTLKIRSFSKGELEKLGNNTFMANSAGKMASNVVVKQGYLEGSNVDATSEMVDMIATIRSFEANQRVLKTQDELLGRAVNDIGRLA